MRYSTILIIIFSSLLMLGTGAVSATEITVSGSDTDMPVSPPLLDGTTIVYTYVDGDSYELSFYKGQSKWHGLAGMPKGESSKDNPYVVHKLDDGVYRVRWNEIRGTDDYDFITLHLDFNSNRIFAASLLSYGDESLNPPEVYFLPGIIHSVERK